MFKSLLAFNNRFAGIVRDMSSGKEVAAAVKKLKFTDGHEMPMVALGTYFGLPEDFTPEQVTESVKSGIDVGYRHIDTAWLYQTEPYVGKGIREKIADGTVTREEIFVTSKLSFAHMMPEDVKPALKESLNNLGLDYLDLYLMHWPMAVNKLPDGSVPAVFTPDQTDVVNQKNDHVKTYRVLEECVKEGLIRSIGISNFNRKQVQRIVDECDIVPATNQIECHLYFSNEKLVKHCQERGVTVTAYTPLGQPHKSWAPEGFVSPLAHPVVLEIAKKYNKSPAQVALRYQIQRNIAVPAKSLKKSRLLENISIFDFNMSDDEMKSLAALNKNDRANWFLPLKSHKDWPFGEDI